MRLTDTFPLRGSLDLRIFKAGREVEHYVDHNMIMAEARNALARLVGGDGSGKVITQIGVGTNGKAPTPQDSGLTKAYTKKLAGCTYPAVGEAVFSFKLGTGEANGMAICELGLLCNDGTLFARRTRGIIEKADDIEIVGTWTIKF